MTRSAVRQSSAADGGRAPAIGEHALVIGASVAGLLCARVLSDFYARVTIVDRDLLPTALDANRRSIPQGHHFHGVHLAGEQALARLFPGWREEVLSAGAEGLRLTEETRFALAGHVLARARVGDLAVAGRPLLEGLIRRRVRAIANVTIRDACAVASLVMDGDHLVGVRTRDSASGSERTRRAELIVAASGRGGRVPQWLESLGYGRPAEERVHVDIVYASRRLRVVPGALGTDKAFVNSSGPGRPRGSVMVAQDGKRWIATLYGYGAAHHPPSDTRGFNAFAATVADHDVAAAITAAEPLSDIHTHAFPASVRRRYDRMRRVPEELLVVGDAMCSFNPIYGQGMTVAALQAEALQRCLHDGHHKLAKRFLKAAQGPVDHAWKLSTAGDLAMPEIDACGTLADRVGVRYLNRLVAAAATDEILTRRLLRVLGMLSPTASLLTPTVGLRVLRGNLRSQLIVSEAADGRSARSAR